MQDFLSNTQNGPGNAQAGTVPLANSQTPTQVNPDLASSVDTSKTIDASKLSSGTNPVTVPQQAPATTDSFLNSLQVGNPATGTPSTTELQGNVDTAQAGTDETSKEINDLLTQLGYKSQDVASMQSGANISGLTKQLTDLNTQFAQKKAAYDQQFQNIGAQNIPTLFTTGQMAIAKAAAASDLGATAAEIQAAQGNLSTAFNTIDKTIDEKYKPIQDQIDTKLKFYQLNKDKLDRAQTILAKRQSDILDLQKQAISNQQGIITNAIGVIKDAVSNGFIEPGAGFKAISDLLNGKSTPADAFAGLGLQQPSQQGIGGSLASAISSVESGGSYNAVGPVIKSGDNAGFSALGKYQIMPNIWFAVIGLDPNKQSDIQKFLNTPALQDQLFDTIISTLTQKYGDQDKAIAAYFGGDPAAQAYGTPAGDKISDGNMTVNQYVNAVKQNLGSQPLGSAQPADDFLKDKTPEQVNAYNSLAPIEQNNVKNLLTGSALLSDLVTSKGIAGQNQRQKLIAEAQKIDPTFSENTNKIRYNFNKDWNDATTVVGKTKTSINTALSHLAETATDAQKMTPSDWKWINKTTNWWDANTGNPNITNLQYGLTLLATEVAAVYKGAAPTDDEIKKQEAILGPDLAKGQFSGLFNTVASRLSGKISSLNYQYKSTMGSNPPQAIIDPAVRQSLIGAGIDPNKISPDPNSAPSATPKGNMSSSDFVQKSLSSANINYNDFVSKVPSGQKAVIDNATGQAGYIPANEFDQSKYTPA